MKSSMKACESGGLPCPYGDLHIYYIQGDADTAERPMGHDFIGNWMEDGFSFLFFSAPSDSIVEKLLADRKDLALVDRYTMSYADWLGETPTTLTLGRFTVSPPWETVDLFYLPCFGAYHMVLDPGVVFGTGTHPTTRDCLDMIEKAMQGTDVQSALDLGCGTGLLSLAAAKMKCSDVLAVDFNALAVKTTVRNIGLNALEDRVRAVQGLAEHYIDHPADLLIANIHYEIMAKIIVSEGFLKKKRFILSGILNSQAKAVEAALSLHPVRIIEHRSESGVWHTFYGEVLDKP